MTARVVAFVPSKLNSQRLVRKNVRPLAGRPLVNWVLTTLADCAVSEAVLYASTEEIVPYVDSSLPFRFVQRPEWLDGDDATVQDFVGEFLRQVPGDVFVLLHITSPFISPTTVDTCIDEVVSGRHDSAFAALEIRRFAWFRGSPLNYALDRPVPRTQDLDPVLVEQSGLYVFTRELFESTGRRVGANPYVQVVDPIEGHDIDTAEELEVAEVLAAHLEARRSNS